MFNFIFHQISSITYNSIILTLISKFLQFLQNLTYDLPNRQCRAFLQGRIQNAVKWSGKKAMCNLERARPKILRPFTREESGGGVQNDKLIAIPKHLKLNELLIYVFIANTLMRHPMSVNMCVVKRHHTHNSVIYLCFFFLLLLQQVFCNIPANQIIISTYS